MEAQLLDAKNIEEYLSLQLKRRIQESKNLAEEIMQFKRKLDEGSIKSKFENSSRILDDILTRVIFSGEISPIGYFLGFFQKINSLLGV